MPTAHAHQSVLESPVLLPMPTTEPSPTTGIPFPLPLFRGTPRAMTCRTTESNAGEASTRDGSGTPDGRKRRESQANVDGYQWKKYGEKNLKCSDTPRSYYKCSVPGCNAKKYVEYDPVTGHIAQTVIKGEHTHGKVQSGYSFDDSPRKPQRKPSGTLAPFPDASPENCNGLLSIMHAAKLASDCLSDNKEEGASRSEDTEDLKELGLQIPTAAVADTLQQQHQLPPAPRLHGLQRPLEPAAPTSSANTDEGVPSWKRQRQNNGRAAAPQPLSVAAVLAAMELPPAAGLPPCEDSAEGGSAGTEGDTVEAGSAGSAEREQEDRKVMFVDTDMENVDDGYKWRKYGRKQVKNSNYPRNYYRCTTEGCPVKKHVERYSRNPRQLMVCYEYLPHSHDAPADASASNRVSRRGAPALVDVSHKATCMSTRRQAAESGTSTRRAADGAAAQPAERASEAVRQHSRAGPTGLSLARSLVLQQQLFGGQQHLAGGFEFPHHAVQQEGVLEQPGLVPGALLQHTGHELRGMQSGVLSPHRIDLLASVVAQQEHLDQVGAHDLL